MRNRFKNKWYGKTGKLGFTLVEVLVAIAILAILAVPLAQSMITSAQINSQSKNVGSASDMAQTVAESMQATQLGNVLTEINGRELKFNIAARDEVSLIGEGTHTRFIVIREKFMAKLK